MIHYAQSGVWLVIRIPEAEGSPPIYWTGIVNTPLGAPCITIDINSAYQFATVEQARLCIKLFFHAIYHKTLQIEAIEWQ